MRIYRFGINLICVTVSISARMVQERAQVDPILTDYQIGMRVETSALFFTSSNASAIVGAWPGSASRARWRTAVRRIFVQGGLVTRKGQVAVRRVEEPLPGAGAPTDPQSRRCSQRCRITRRVPTPRLLGVKWPWVVIVSVPIPTSSSSSYPGEVTSGRQLGVVRGHVVGSWVAALGVFGSPPLLDQLS